MLKVGVVGLGFVGLTSALGLAKQGHAVAGYDSDAEKTAILRQGQVPFHEPGLPEALRELQGRAFHLADDMQAAVQEADVVLFCVGTPSHPDGAADLSHLIAAIKQALAHCDSRKYRTFCVKSTVPPSTCREQLLPLVAAKRERVGISSNPEFLRESHAWRDFMQPDRIVIGSADARCEELLVTLYQGFAVPLHKTTLSEAEFIKNLSNTLLSTMVSFSNEMSMLAHRVGDIDIKRAFGILHEDKRWSGAPANMAAYAYPGCGYGGYCLPKDTQSMLALARQKEAEAPLLAAVDKINRDIAGFWADRIAAATAQQDKIAWLGLAFKPGSSDVRQTPALPILSRLVAGGHGGIVAYDPLAMDEFRRCYPDIGIACAATLEECLQDAAAVVVATAWPEFTAERDLLKRHEVFDLRYCL